MTINKRRGPAESITIPLKSVVLFAIYVALGNLCLAQPFASKWITGPVTTTSAQTAAAVCDSLGLPVEARDTVVSYRETRLNVQEGCNGLDLALIFMCAVLAYPVGWLSRLVGVVAGVLVILAMNLLRLVNLLWVGAHFPSRFEFFHIWVWQPLTMLLTFAVLVLWWRYLAGSIRAGTLTEAR